MIAVFALQTTVSVAFAACICPEIKDQAIQMDDASGDMPCHAIEKAEMDTTADDNQQADCNQCACGHCTVSTTGALATKLSPDPITSFNTVAMSGNDRMKSIFPYGIDYPPKRFS